MNGKSESQFTALAPHYDELMEVVPYDVWADYILLLLQVVEYVPATILDCCCGTGNVSFELAQRGFNVTGVDIASEMIAVAQAKNERIGTDLRFFEADLTDFRLSEQFDCATCLYDSLNYILDPVALQNAFKCVSSHVKAGGIFIFDMNSEFALTADLFTQYSRNPRKKLHYDWHARHDAQTKITEVEMLFTRYEPNGQVSHFRETHREKAYSLAEIETMLDLADWELLKTYDAYTLNLPHDASERWFFVARKR